MKTKEQKNWLPVYGTKDNTGLIIKLPAGVKTTYVGMNGRTYYLDDSTGKASTDSWPTLAGYWDTESNVIEGGRRFKVIEAPTKPKAKGGEA